LGSIACCPRFLELTAVFRDLCLLVEVLCVEAGFAVLLEEVFLGVAGLSAVVVWAIESVAARNNAQLTIFTGQSLFRSNAHLKKIY
jgi:hypothetical protein